MCKIISMNCIAPLKGSQHWARTGQEGKKEEKKKKNQAKAIALVCVCRNLQLGEKCKDQIYSHLKYVFVFM